VPGFGWADESVSLLGACDRFCDLTLCSSPPHYTHETLTDFNLMILLTNMLMASATTLHTDKIIVYHTIKRPNIPSTSNDIPTIVTQEIAISLSSRLSLPRPLPHRGLDSILPTSRPIPLQC